MGNPSDGYHGKTISIIVRNFWAEVTLYEWEDLELVSTELDQSCFRSVDDLVRDVRLHGYYGGIRLVKATIKKFTEFCRRQGFYGGEACHKASVIIADCFHLGLLEHHLRHPHPVRRALMPPGEIAGMRCEPCQQQ